MKKLLIIFVIGILLISGIGAAALQENIVPTSILKKHSESLTFSEPIIKSENDYVFIDLKESNSNLQQTDTNPSNNQ